MTAYWVLRYQKQSKQLLDESIAAAELRTQKIYLSTAKELVDKVTSLYLKILASGGTEKVTRNTVYQYERYYDMLKEILEKLDELGVKLTITLEKELETMYIDSSKFTGRAIEVQGVKSVYNKLDERAKEAANEVWASDGKTWSSRIWKDVALLKSTLEEELVNAVATGQSASKLAEKLQHMFSVSYSQAKRLAVTEMAHIYNVASTDRMKKADIEEYEVYSAEDAKVCKECAAENHKRYPLNDKTHLPPLHCNCRCTTLAIIPNKYLNKTGD